MTYQLELEETQQKKFADLFEIRTGIEPAERFTSHEEPIVFDFDTYINVPISLSSYKLSNDLSSVSVQITAPVSENLSRYIANSVSEPTTVKVTRVVVDDVSKFAVIFDGEIADIEVFDTGEAEDGTPNPLQAKASCESISILNRNRLPDMAYQAECNNTLYDDVCQVDRNDFTIVETITIDGTGQVLTASGASGYADDFFSKGVIKTSFGDRRLITQHKTDQLSILYPFDSRLEDGATVEISAGCDKAVETCRDKFDNVERFRGMIFIPNNNPAVWGYL
jgi:uncharacterized phage protein (TIGR02218 family)